MKRTGTRVPYCLFAVCSTESLIKSVSHVCWLPQQELGKAQRGYIVRSTADETSDRSVNRDEECLKGTIVNDLDSLAHLFLTRGFADEEQQSVSLRKYESAGTAAGENGNSGRKREQERKCNRHERQSSQCFAAIFDAISNPIASPSSRLSPRRRSTRNRTTVSPCTLVKPECFHRGEKEKAAEWNCLFYESCLEPLNGC